MRFIITSSWNEKVNISRSIFDRHLKLFLYEEHMISTEILTETKMVMFSEKIVIFQLNQVEDKLQGGLEKHCYL